MLYALAIAQRQGLPEKDKDILGAAAAFHDSRRQDDWLDVGHGQRAADYYREYCVSHKLDFEQKCYDIIYYHDRDDQIGIDVISGRSPLEQNGVVLYKIFKDADALERALRSIGHAGFRYPGTGKEICVVGLAGSGRRMGVTYFSLACAAYATGHGERALYLECNESAVAEQLSTKAGKEEGDGVFRYHGIHMAECRAFLKKSGAAGYSIGEEIKYYSDCGYSVILADFGVLTTENLEGFACSDLCLFFAGEKDWELENTWRGLTRLAGLEDKLMLLLFGSSKRRCRAFSKRLPGIVCRRLPFINGTEGAPEKEVMFERAM